MRIFAGIVTALVLAAPVSAAEHTFVFQQEAPVAGSPYRGVVDYTKQRYPQHKSQWSREDIRWYAYGPATLGESYQLRRIVSVFDIGALPRGTVKSALLTYTIRYDKDVEKADWCAVFSTAPPHLEDGVELARGEVPPGSAGENLPVTFDVTEYVKDCRESARFELRSGHDRYMVSAWTSGLWGPWARAKDLPFGKEEYFPRLEVVVEAPAVPQPPRQVWVAVGQRAGFGGDGEAVFSIVGKPGESRLGDSDITGNSFVPDAAGRFVVKSVSGGVTQYSTVIASPVHGSHPRLSIDDAAVERLRTAARAGDAAWQKLKAEADALVATEGAQRGYAGFGYRQAIDKLTIAYLVADDERYARKAVEVMDVAHADGLVLVSSDAGYCIRAYGPAIATGYDRLHDFLTEEQKTRYWKDLNYWLAWYADSGYQRNGPAMGNYFSGYVSALYSAAYATYGENPLAPVLIDEAQRLFDTIVLPEIDGGVLEGGDDPEGRYAGLYFETWFHYLLTRKLCGEADLLEGLGWPEEVAMAYIHRTRPDERTFYDYGAWRDQEPSWISPGPMVVLSWLLSGSRAGEYAQYYAAKYGKPEFSITFDPARKATFWGSETTSYFSRGLGLATARSSWERDAVWVSMQGGGAPFCDHQHRDFGHFEIFRGEDELLADTNTEDGGEGSQWHNCLLVDVPEDLYKYTPGQYGGEPHKVLSFEDTESAVVMHSDLAPNYRGVRSTPLIMKNYTRTHAYIRPDVFVVVDRFESANPEWRTHGRLNFTGVPDIGQGIVSAVKGSSRIKARFFGDAVNLERVEGHKLLENSVDYVPVEQAGPQTVVVVLTIGGVNEKLPDASAVIENGKVKISVEGETALVLDAGGAIDDGQALPKE